MPLVEYVPIHSDSLLPVYGTEFSAAADLHAYIPEGDIAILPLCRAIINTGIRVIMDESLHCEIRPRSGLAAKHGITVLNAPGTIDADYENEIRVILHNTDPYEKFIVKHGDRIAQILPVETISKSLTNAIVNRVERGMGGFGSTGVEVNLATQA